MQPNVVAKPTIASASVALGVEAEVVARMNQKDVRDMLKYPAKVAKDSE